MLLDEKLQKLIATVQECDSAVVAFSGGVDSSLVCAVSCETLGTRAAAVTAISQTYPPEELESAQAIAKLIGIRHILIQTNELENPKFTENPAERCYYCKLELLHRLEEIRKKLGFKFIFDGTNFDDMSDFRPGIRATKEFGVVSPLAVAGLTKLEVRELASYYGLPNAEKPASPCLASRIPFGQRITAERLRRIARGEGLIRSLGFRVVRVRDHGSRARIEVGKEELDRAFSMKDTLIDQLKGIGFLEVEIDPCGYRTGGANLQYSAYPSGKSPLKGSDISSGINPRRTTTKHFSN